MIGITIESLVRYSSFLKLKSISQSLLFVNNSSKLRPLKADLPVNLMELKIDLQFKEDTTRTK